METKGLSRGWVVLVPAPFQGHITPMLQLGSILHSRGFQILVAHAECISPDPLKHPEFEFLSLPDDFSGCDKSLENIRAHLAAINNNCKASLQDYLVRMIEKDQQLHGKIACIIYDTIMHFTESVANCLKLPSIIMRVYNAAYVLALQVTFGLQEDNCLPLQESQMQETVPKLQGFRFKDLPLSLTSKIPERSLEFMKSMINVRSSRAVIWNTIDELEHPSLSQLQQHHRVPNFCIGSFHKMAPAFQTSLLEEDYSCIAWLDKQAPSSVLYVSLGSLTTIDEKEFIETAWGLVKSDQPFLWVVRPGSVNGTEWIEKLPEGFEKANGGKGYIVKWAPQKQVLAHSAVGGFWSHCGWNSTLESIFEGVPMICKPRFGDHLINARYITHIWKLGLEMEPAFGREDIEKTIRKLMVDTEGKEMRKRALDMKEKIEVCVQKGGSSHKSLNDFVDFISSLSLEK